MAKFGVLRGHLYRDETAGMKADECCAGTAGEEALGVGLDGRVWDGRGVAIAGISGGFTRAVELGADGVKERACVWSGG